MFFIQLLVAERQCVGQKGKVFDTTGMLSSQLPRDSSGRINCTWLITVPEGSIVKLELEGSVDFKLFQNGQLDLLRVRFKKYFPYLPLYKHCPFETKAKLFSSGRFLRVKYTGYWYLDFKATFEAQQECESHNFNFFFPFTLCISQVRSHVTACYR